MAPVFDIRCDRCDNIWEEVKKYEDPAPECPKCGSYFTRTLLGTIFVPRAKDPYDYLDGYRPSTKPIKSYASDKRQKGKDTS